MSIRTFVLGLCAAAVAVVAPLTAPPLATAEPAFVPDANDVVGVGSDTTELVMHALAARYNDTAVTGGRRLASFDATGSAEIRLRSGTPTIDRPNGSSEGVDWLQRNDDISYARSVRGPRSGDEGTTFYPYARDGLSYLVARPTNANLQLTVLGMRSIYTCERRAWPSGERIRALVPRFGSGTRDFFLSEIGMTEVQKRESQAQPDRYCDVSEVQGNDPAVVINRPNAIVPFSAARYQTLPAAEQNRVRYASDAPVETSRDVYHVIRSRDTADLGQFFGQSSWICESTAAGEIITEQGFTRLPEGQCGFAIPF